MPLRRGLADDVQRRPVPRRGGNAGHLEMAQTLISTRLLEIISSCSLGNARSPGKPRFPDFQRHFQLPDRGTTRDRPCAQAARPGFARWRSSRSNRSPRRRHRARHRLPEHRADARHQTPGIIRYRKHQMELVGITNVRFVTRAHETLRQNLSLLPSCLSGLALLRLHANASDNSDVSSLPAATPGQPADRRPVYDARLCGGLPARSASAPGSVSSRSSSRWSLRRSL